MIVHLHPFVSSKIFKILTAVVIFLLQSNNHIASCQDSTYKTYPFIIQDSPALLYTMHQSDMNYLSGYRLFSSYLDNHLNIKHAELVKLPLLFFTLVITHEEGHRSVLTSENIGSVSRPFFNKHGVAYVQGVTDETLQNLRDTRLPVYIRLHTAGLESDYMLTKETETLISFGQENFKTLWIEYYLRKFQIIQYYMYGLFGAEVDIKEEPDELKRDIVGHDIYGAVRHLYRPDMEFHRYTRFAQLTSEEKKFVRTAGWYSLLNLVSPLILGKENFNLTENLKFNFGLGYTMVPFGGMIDENMWFTWKGKNNISFYVREYYNKNNWFPAAGIGLEQYPLFSGKVLTDISGHIWSQPESLSFTTGKSTTGGAIDLTLRIPFFIRTAGSFRAISLDAGLIYKTKGFLPEEIIMDEHLGFRIGTSLFINTKSQQKVTD